MEKDKDSQDRLGRKVEDWVLIGLLAGALLYSSHRHNDRPKLTIENLNQVPAQTVTTPR